MKKYLISILLGLSLSSLSFGVDKIVTQDPTKPGIFKVNGPIVTNGIINFTTNSIPLFGLVTNAATTGSVMTFTNNTWQPFVFAGGGEQTTASNIGNGTNIFSSIVGFDLQFKTLLPGSGISFLGTSSNVTISLAPSVAVTNFTTYLTQSVSPAGAGTYTTLLVVTNGQTTGHIDVFGKVQYTDNNASSAAITGARLLEVNFAGTATNILDSSVSEHTSADIYHAALPLGPICRTITGTNLYILQGVVQAVPGAGEGWRPFWTTLSATTFSGTNSTWITIKRY